MNTPTWTKIGIATATLLAIAACGSASPEPATSAPPSSAGPVATAPATPKPSKPAGTVSELNALGKAQEYIDMDGFSKSGLVDQLTFEGYSKADATWAVNHLHADWNAEAVEKAQSYMELDHFSRSGLIDQLTYEGFTQAQAAHAATAVGL